MGSTFGGLEIGKRSLFAQQSALNTVSHNIANANTEGYTRQRAVMRATEAYPSASSMNNPVIPGQIGTGVMVTETVQLRDQFLDQQYYRENMDFGTYDTKQSMLDHVQNILNEPSDNGLQNAMNQFWQSWQNLAKDPSNSSAHQIVIESGNALTDTFHQISKSIKDLKSDIGTITDTDSSPTMIGDNLKQINTYTSQIKDLNDRIAHNVASGYTPNDLYDQRNLILDNLSKIANITVTHNLGGNGKDTGMIDVSIINPSLTSGATSYDILKGNVQKKFPTDPNSPGDPNGLNFLTGGKLKSLVDLVDSSNGKVSGVDSYLNQINTLANNLALKLSTNNDPNPPTPPLGISLFANGTTPSNNTIPIDAANITLSASILSTLDPTKTSSPFVIDTSIARQISNDLNTAYQQTISGLGTDVQDAQQFSSNAEISKNAVDANRQSVSGVSLDEEMTDMIKYQHAYSAASRTITTMDEMLDKLINGTGKVGL